MTTASTRRLETGGPSIVRPRFTFTGRFVRIRGTGRRTDHFQFHSPYKAAPLYTGVRQSRIVMSEKKTVEIEDRSDRWRFVCPRGHRSWEPTNHHFWCQSCARATGVDGVFHQLRDRKTGTNHEREEVQLLTSLGPYDEIDERRGSA